MSIKLEEGQYWGTRQYQVYSNDLIITYSHYNANKKLPLHFHENFLFGFITEGNYFEKVLKNTSICSQGSLIIQPAQMEHENTFTGSNAKCLNVELPKKKVEEMLDSKISFNDWMITKDVKVDLCVYKIMEEVHAPVDSLSHLVIDSLVNEILVYCSRIKDEPVNRAPYKIKRVKEWLDENYFIPQSLKQLSDNANMTSFHLSREFKKCYGYGIGEYVRKKRITEAVYKLKYQKKDVASVALECGFSDASHFIRLFKKSMGCTPKQFCSRN